jgi:hypothetical protein
MVLKQSIANTAHHLPASLLRDKKFTLDTDLEAIEMSSGTLSVFAQEVRPRHNYSFRMPDTKSDAQRIAPRFASN